MRIIVVGAGVVGEACGRALLSMSRRVSFVDSSADRCASLATAGLDCSTQLVIPDEPCMVLVCVPTPADASGYALIELEACIRSIGRSIVLATHHVLIVVRSTVPPGTCSGPVTSWLEAEIGNDAAAPFSLVHVPEFLRAASALDDALRPRITVIGSSDEESASLVMALVGPLAGEHVVLCSLTEAELAKCAHNAYNATKISFWNEMHAIAVAQGANPDVVGDIVSRSAEASWNPEYGIRGGRPYDGACLPKDVLGLAQHAVARGVDPVMLRAVHERNLLAADAAD